MGLPGPDLGHGLWAAGNNFPGHRGASAGEQVQRELECREPTHWQEGTSSPMMEGYGNSCPGQRPAEDGGCHVRESGCC